ncbi:MAG: MOSC domain-containing protein [Deltaproteobacteria bacterium]|nr:MOSC domain-containing protein [Deltaproteobacteria bacterium]
MGRLLSVNVSLPKEIIHKGKKISSGIFKEPVKGRIKVNSLNLEGDGQADLLAHGGNFRAVYVYSYDNYAYWEKELNRDDFKYGQFGENFTVEGMSDDEIHVGDRFKIGSALFEVTQPRVPCYKLAIKMGEEGFYNQILSSGRLGFYFRVIEEGDVGAGDIIEKVSEDTQEMTINEVNSLLYFNKDDFNGIEKAIKIKALSPGWKTSFEDRLAKAELSEQIQDKYITLTVSKKVPESKTITSFYLVSEGKEPLPSFLPGQFLPLKLDIPGQYKPVIRTYSISDSPNKDYYRLTIKREPAPPDRPDLYPGVSSNYFHDQVEPGTKLLAKAPRGKFFLDSKSENPVVLLSAGVGLTPLISMLNAIVDSGSNREVWFIHGARNSAEHVMGDHIRKVAQQYDNVHVHVAYSQPLKENVEGRDYDSKGYVDVELLKNILPGNEACFYLCGPPPFMKSLFNGLLEWEVPEYLINYEFFGPASLIKDRAKVSTPKRAAEAVDSSTEVEVEFSSSGIKTNWNPSFESILDLAEANGLSPDYSCRSGVCHTCMCRLEDGEVEYVEEPLDPPDEGFVLICVCKPKKNVVVEI